MTAMNSRVSKIHARQLKKLEKVCEGSEGEIDKSVRKRMEQLRLLILNTCAEDNVATNAVVRDRCFKALQAELFELEKAIEKTAVKAIGDVAKIGHESALLEAGKKNVDPGLMKYDHDRTKQYHQLVAPQNGQNLAAVFTQKIGGNLIQNLRNTYRTNFQEAQLNGWSTREQSKRLQIKWAEIAQDENNFRFIDSAGRKWDNARYAQMLTRTNNMRVYNDSMADSIIGMGLDLARISEGGDPDCPKCAAWEGQIVSITGTDKRFPTYDQARVAGVFHPNCVHTLEYVDPDIDEDEIARQAKMKPMQHDPASMARHKDAVDEQRHIDNGMTRSDARVQVTKDRLERIVRNGISPQHSKEVVSALDTNQLRQLRKHGIPDFNVANKGQAAGVTENAVRVPRDYTTDDVVSGLKKWLKQKGG